MARIYLLALSLGILISPHHVRGMPPFLESNVFQNFRQSFQRLPFGQQPRYSVQPVRSGSFRHQQPPPQFVGNNHLRSVTSNHNRGSPSIGFATNILPKHTSPSIFQRSSFQGGPLRNNFDAFRAYDGSPRATFNGLGGFQQGADVTGLGPFRRFPPFHPHRRDRGRPHRRGLFRKLSSKIIVTFEGFLVPGGIAIKGAYLGLEGCKLRCARMGSCLAGDFNAHNGICYVHTSATACDSMEAHEASTHFQKAPCSAPETSTGSAIFSGRFLGGGILLSGVKSFSDCVKQCSQAGEGLASGCFGLDYDYTDHKCYIHSSEANSCPIPNEDTLPSKANTVHVVYCP